jgi:hypothetical protein
LRVAELESALCNQDKLFYKVFRENKNLNFELENSFFEIASLRSVHDDMSAKPCDNCTMIMVNYADMWLMHSQVASQLKCAKLELRELKARSLLLGACTSCPLLRSNLEAFAVEIKDLKYKLEHPSRYSVLSHPCDLCGSLKGKLFYVTKENTELQQEITYLTARLQKIALSEKMIEYDLSRVEESVTKSAYKLGVGFERCEDKGERSVPKFVPSSSYHKEEEALNPTKTNYPSNPKPSFNHKIEVRKETPKSREEDFVFMFCGHADHLDEFCFRHKRIEKRRFEYAKTHIVMSSLIFRLTFTDMLRLALLLMLCLVSLMDLTIAHMVLVHERITLSLNALVMAYVLIVVIVSFVGLVFLLEGLALTLNSDT